MPGIHSVHKILCEHNISIHVLSFTDCILTYCIYLFTMNVKIKKYIKYLNTPTFFKTIIIIGYLIIRNMIY